jgi:hypothetical protein
LGVDLACAVTAYVPEPTQECEAAPTLDHGETAPSPQVNWYWTGLPTLDVEPPVVYV